MKTSEQGLALIRQCEGFSALPYICPAGKETIGYGHCLHFGEKYPPEGISRNIAENMLIQDVAAAEQAVNTLVTAPLNQNQFDALAAFVYNIGGKAFEKSTLLRILNAGDTERAAGEFNRWVYAGGRKIEGLVRRRALEAALFNQNMTSEV